MAKLRDVAKAFLHDLPAPVQVPARWFVDWVRYPPGSGTRKKINWVKRNYTPFGRRQRLNLMLDIARFANINRPIDGYYFEFGCHEANTMRMAWKCFRHLTDWHFVAFDSFEGLPEIPEIDRQEIWEKGKLKTTEEDFVRLCTKAGMPRNRLTTVKGFYDQSLTGELKHRLSPTKAAVVYVDCDLYVSTIPVLKFVRDFLQPGTVIVFDDWNCFLGSPNKGERRAWQEFCEENPALRFEPFVSTGMQQSFLCVDAGVSSVEPLNLDSRSSPDTKTQSAHKESPEHI